MEAATAERSQLTMDVGGREPTSATLTLLGGAHEIDVDLEKEEVVRIEVEAVVRKVGFSDVVDAKTDNVVGCRRQHHARITSFRIVD